MKKWCIAFVCVAVLMVSPFLIAPVINNARLSTFANQLYQTPTPPNTEVIEAQSLCGRLGGTGNGMDYLAALLIQSDLSAAALAEYYEAQEYKPAGARGAECLVAIQALPEFAKPPIFLAEPLEFVALADASPENNCFQVILYNGGYSGAFDLRAH